MEKLFDDKERNTLRYSKHREKPYSFYDETAMPQFVTVREMLNEWFSRYPASHMHSLKRDFQSQFDAAFFELFIHELFIQQGFVLTPHPDVPNSSKNPDFLAQKGGCEIYLEAKVATDKSNEERTLENKRNAIYDELQQLKSPDYWIDIRAMVFKSNNQAKLSKIKVVIQKWLNETHLHSKVIYNDSDYFGEQFFTYKDDDITLSLSLFPSSIEKDHPIASYLGGSYSGGCEQALTNAIREKATRYGNLDKPYIVCINLPGIRQPYSDEIYNTLFGRLGVMDGNFKGETAPYSPEVNGLLKNSIGPVFKQASAFFITRVFPSNLHVADHWLIEHPHANSKLNFEDVSLTFSKQNSFGVETVNKKSINQIVFSSNP